MMPNKFKGICFGCGCDVKPMEGAIRRAVIGIGNDHVKVWAVEHPQCVDSGVPCTKWLYAYKKSMLITMRDRVLLTLDELQEKLKDICPPIEISEGGVLESDYPEKTGPHHLLWMIAEMKENRFMDDDKINRWLGFIQGVMCSRGWLIVDVERDRTRIIFKSEE